MNFMAFTNVISMQYVQTIAVAITALVPRVISAADSNVLSTMNVEFCPSPIPVAVSTMINVVSMIAVEMLSILICPVIITELVWMVSPVMVSLVKMKTSVRNLLPNNVLS